MNETEIYTKLISDIETSDLSVLLIPKDYTSEALLFLKNNAKTLNYYKQDDLLPDRAKKSNFSFVEIVWIRAVYELKSIGIKVELLKQLKNELFNAVDADAILNQFKKKEEEINNLYKELPIEHIEFIKAEFENALKKKSPLIQIQMSKLFMCLSYMLQHKSPLDIRLYNDGAVTMYDIQHDVELDMNLAKSLPGYKSYISISLTEIICFYIGENFIKTPLKEYIFSKDELLILETIKKDKPVSITIEFNNNNTIDLIKVKMQQNININQRLSEILLSNAYEDITITTQKGKIVNCTKVKKIKP